MESQETKNESNESIKIKELENRIEQLENRIEQLEKRIVQLELFRRVGF